MAAQHGLPSGMFFGIRTRVSIAKPQVLSWERQDRSAASPFQHLVHVFKSSGGEALMKAPLRRRFLNKAHRQSKRPRVLYVGSDGLLLIQSVIPAAWDILDFRPTGHKS